DGAAVHSGTVAPLAYLEPGPAARARGAARAWSRLDWKSCSLRVMTHPPRLGYGAGMWRFACAAAGLLASCQRGPSGPGAPAPGPAGPSALRADTPPSDTPP